MRSFIVLILILLTSCTKEKVILLPEINGAEINNVLDVSPAYLFYDETQPDSVVLNRKNLISTTNWLVNVDKRLTLKQAIPHIIYLQDKKRNAKMHKNENAKNYFTCNDISINSLGFVEFTATNFITAYTDDFKNDHHFITFETPSIIEVITPNNDRYNVKKTDLVEIIEKVYTSEDNDRSPIVLVFSENLTFQEYIDLKSSLKPSKGRISENEFIIQP